MSELLSSLLQDARIWQGHKHRETTQPAESTGYQVLDNQLGGLGWPRGALSERLLDTCGIGELHLVLPLMQRISAAGKTIFWLNPPHTPYAPALAREGVDLDHLVMINTRDQGDLLWTMKTACAPRLPGWCWPGRASSPAGMSGVCNWRQKPAAMCVCCSVAAGFQSRTLRQPYGWNWCPVNTRNSR